MTTATDSAATAAIIVPEVMFDIAAESIGAFFEPISPIDRRTSSRDFLGLDRASKRAGILQRYAILDSKKLLDVGSGIGTMLAAWIKDFHVVGYGTEPGGEGFKQGFIASRQLFANGIDPGRIQNTAGEEMPNFLSYFEGHYLVLPPPILFNAMLAWWAQLVFRRDPAFDRTLRTRINPIWCRRTVARLGRSCPLRLISLGDDLFLDRRSQVFTFEARSVADRLQEIIAALKKVNRGQLGRTPHRSLSGPLLNLFDGSKDLTHARNNSETRELVSFH